VDLDWNGETDGKSYGELEQIGNHADTEHLSVGTHVGADGDWAAVFIFPRIADKKRHLLMATKTCPGRCLLGALSGLRYQGPVN